MKTEVDLLPCPFCGGAMQHRYALWPSEGDRDAIIHAQPTDCPIEGAFSIDTFDNGVSVAEAWNRRPASPSIGRVVKGLNFEAYGGRFRATTPFGRYMVRPHRDHWLVCWNGQPLVETYATDRLALAAAQAHYESRILSALSTEHINDD